MAGYTRRRKLEAAVLRVLTKGWRRRASRSGRSSGGCERKIVSFAELHLLKEPMERAGSYIAKLTAPDGYEEKFSFSDQAGAMNWLVGDGLKNFDGDVEWAEVWDPSGICIYRKHEPKVVDQLTAAWRSTLKAGLYWNGRPSKPEAVPTELFCRTCQAMVLYRATEPKYRWSTHRQYFCAKCDNRIQYNPRA